jgi:hypothetical protein
MTHAEPAPESEDSTWWLVIYQEKVADLRWTKERSTNVTYWAILLLGGLVALSTGPIQWPIWAIWILQVFSVAIVVFSIWWIKDLHDYAIDARAWIQGPFLDHCPFDVELEVPPPASGMLHIVAKSSAIAVALLLSSYAIWQL